MAAKSNLAKADPPASRKKKAPVAAPGSQALQLDRLIHERTRLAVVSALAGSGALSFSELKRLLELTDGNLSVHARKLEEAGYVKCSKGFAGRFSRSEYTLTREGRKALKNYLGHMEALIQAARK
jgi:DNA-binding MarR family transcriptional regulator